MQIIVVLLAVCGVHVFMKKEINSYLFLQKQFVFVDTFDFQVPEQRNHLE